MHLEIITPEKSIYTGEVDMVTLPGTEGSFGLLQNHAPIISTLKQGTIKVLQKEGGKNDFNPETGKIVHSTKNDKELSFAIDGGVIEMNNNKIIVLAE